MEVLRESLYVLRRVEDVAVQRVYERYKDLPVGSLRCVSSEDCKLVLYEAKETGDVHGGWYGMRIVAVSWLIWRGGIIADLMEQGVEAGYVDLPPATRRAVQP